eukprot:Nk52_evm1s214 gene=Nk52_evmTU1s214
MWDPNPSNPSSSPDQRNAELDNITAFEGNNDGHLLAKSLVPELNRQSRSTKDTLSAFIDKKRKPLKWMNCNFCEKDESCHQFICPACAAESLKERRLEYQSIQSSKKDLESEIYVIINDTINMGKWGDISSSCSNKDNAGKSKFMTSLMRKYKDRIEELRQMSSRSSHKFQREREAVAAQQQINSELKERLRKAKSNCLASNLGSVRKKEYECQNYQVEVLKPGQEELTRTRREVVRRFLSFYPLMPYDEHSYRIINVLLPSSGLYQHQHPQPTTPPRSLSTPAAVDSSSDSQSITTHTQPQPSSSPSDSALSTNIGPNRGAHKNEEGNRGIVGSNASSSGNALKVSGGLMYALHMVRVLSRVLGVILPVEMNEFNFTRLRSSLSSGELTVAGTRTGESNGRGQRRHSAASGDMGCGPDSGVSARSGSTVEIPGASGRSATSFLLGRRASSRIDSVERRRKEREKLKGTDMKESRDKECDSEGRLGCVEGAGMSTELRTGVAERAKSGEDSNFAGGNGRYQRGGRRMTMPLNVSGGGSDNYSREARRSASSNTNDSYANDPLNPANRPSFSDARFQSELYRLNYNIAYLCYSQGVLIEKKDLPQTLRNLYLCTKSVSLGREDVLARMQQRRNTQQSNSGLDGPSRGSIRAGKDPQVLLTGRSSSAHPIASSSSSIAVQSFEDALDYDSCESDEPFLLETEWEQISKEQLG